MKTALVLTIAGLLIAPAAAFMIDEKAADAVLVADAKPVRDTVLIQLNLTGVATRTNGGPDGGYMAFMNVTGLGERMTPNGKGVQIRATGLEADVVIVRNADSVEVENFTALVGFHAQSASCVATGGEEGCFKFSLQLRGQRAVNVITNTANPDGRVLAMNAKGDTVGTSDEDGAFVMEASGQSTSQPNGTGSGAHHYNLDLGGTGSIRTFEDGDSVPTPKAYVPAWALVPKAPASTPLERLVGDLRGGR